MSLGSLEMGRIAHLLQAFRLKNKPHTLLFKFCFTFILLFLEKNLAFWSPGMFRKNSICAKDDFSSWAYCERCTRCKLSPHSSQRGRNKKAFWQLPIVSLAVHANTSISLPPLSKNQLLAGVTETLENEGPDSPAELAVP